MILHSRICRRLLSAALIFWPLAVLSQVTDLSGQSDAVPATATPDAVPVEPDQNGGPSAIKLGEVQVRAKRPATPVGVLPGLNLTKDEIPGNVQSGSAAQLRDSHALSIADFANTELQGINVNDYSGNPFQLSLNYRGFTASPEVGTPQGLSVFFDGVRVNEPFGDIVNWDLIPINAIEHFDLFPGSNPIFGLNTLGGAIAIHSKSGFTAPGVEVSGLGGSFARKQGAISGGIHNDSVAGFVALNAFDEDGWRDNSPTTVYQGFGRADWRGEQSAVYFTTLLAQNKLVGNGVVPIDVFNEDREAVFTSPDRSSNALVQFTLNGTFDVSDVFNVTGQGYHRSSRQKSYNGDVYEGFQSLDYFKDRVLTSGAALPNALPICQFLNRGDGIEDGAPFNGPEGVNCQRLQYAPLPTTNQPRNGGPSNGFLGAGGSIGPGVVDGTPVGLINRTRLDQSISGGALQLNFNLEQHKFLIGASIDSNSAAYLLTQQLGLIDASHDVYADPANIDAQYRAAQVPIVANDFDGTEKTYSAYFSETWSPLGNLHFTASTRYNLTRTDSAIRTRADNASRDLHEIRNRNVPPGIILCPTSDPASCPDAPESFMADVDSVTSNMKEKFTFVSLNPSLGFNWQPIKQVNLFANVSHGTRVPSVVELGCAFDDTPVAAQPNAEPGSPLADLTVARSLRGPTCSLPTTLSGDPYLKQIKALSAEIGGSGRLWSTLQWNISGFRTNLKDDIYYVGVADGRSYFDTVGKTRRQGLELGFKGSYERLDAGVDYSYVDATFESTFYVRSPNNSSADFDQNSYVSLQLYGKQLLPSPSVLAGANHNRGTFLNIRVDPGARLPGIPAHTLNAHLRWRITAAFDVKLSMLARSLSYVRGNENNRHQAAGTDKQTGLYTCQGVDSCLYGIYEQDFTGPGKPFRTFGTVGGYAIFNFDTSYKVGHGFTLFGKITNLLDKTYFSGGRLGVNPFSPSTIGAIGPSGFNYNSSEWQNTTFVAPGAPRGFFGGFNYAWGGPPT